MGMHFHVVVGPFLLLPETTISTNGTPRKICPQCNPGAPREGAYCQVCGAPLVETTPVREDPLSLFEMDGIEEDVFWQPNDTQAIFLNARNAYTHTLAGDQDSLDAPLIFTEAQRQEAIDWYTPHCKPLFEWCAQRNLPEPRIEYGLVSFFW